jgi:hypothetical protein
LFELFAGLKPDDYWTVITVMNKHDNINTTKALSGSRTFIGTILGCKRLGITCEARAGRFASGTNSFILVTSFAGSLACTIPIKLVTDVDILYTYFITSHRESQHPVAINYSIL